MRHHTRSRQTWSFCHVFILILFLCTLEGCGGQRAAHYALRHNSAVQKTPCPQRKTTRPYKLKGVWHYPQKHYELDEIGVASYYGKGDGTHGRLTANGERFDRYKLTAAHKTAHLPSIAVVTNLRNGRKIKVRINDRGPFKRKRILDVSWRAAQLLGFERQGITLVRVQVLPIESQMLSANRSKHAQGMARLFRSSDSKKSFSESPLWSKKRFSYR